MLSLMLTIAPIIGRPEIPFVTVPLTAAPTGIGSASTLAKSREQLLPHALTNLKATYNAGIFPAPVGSTTLLSFHPSTKLYLLKEAASVHVVPFVDHSTTTLSALDA